MSREQTNKRNEKMTVIIIFLTVFFLPVVIGTLFISYSKNLKKESIGIKHLKNLFIFY
jgi:flagellar basal body-associated protein FliL